MALKSCLLHAIGPPLELMHSPVLVLASVYVGVYMEEWSRVEGFLRVQVSQHQAVCKHGRPYRAAAARDRLLGAGATAGPACAGCQCPVSVLVSVVRAWYHS